MDDFCCTSNFMVFVLFLALQLHNSSEAFGTLRFDIHHRYSDPVKGILELPWLPKKGSIQYYSAWTQRDRDISRHRLTSTIDTTPNSRRLTSAINPTPLPLTFAGRGNKTVLLSSLGFLHYANVTVGTPGLSFLVALDTGSDLFWLPCNCNNCAHTLLTGSGRPIDLNIYSPNTSSTSKIVPCSGTLCAQGRQCSVAQSACAYRVAYLSHNTSSSGVLVEDILHLQTDSTQQKAVEAPITFGCGMKQTGAFSNGAAPNGLFGLSMGNLSVPSVLANKGLAANSFSLCFGADGIGRIDFGDKGSLDQGETPFNLEQTHQTYNISLTGITVGNKNVDVDFTAIFDSGTSFTYLNDPAYKVITENYNSQAQELRIQPMVQVPFEYCYGLRANQTYFQILDVNLMMKGGNQFYLFDPIITLSLPDGSTAYCLAVVKSGDVNIIGQNFMTGYQVVFDREKMVLGWKPSNCYDSKESKSKTTLPVNKQRPTKGSDPTSGLPEDTRENGNGIIRSTPDFTASTSAGNYVTKSLTFFCQLVVVLFFLYSHYLII
ncbi:aspartyl protease family protein 1-like isoform X1 [Solanum pennellii]|uniref:Aspartyl protease family protein 1-like isoform X1 n=1 Tax=Solanum pennellii TaxID=28526 RepID=A0ABM1G8L5_SOLPN|nr:aspartyl protease family protein 1-like isoform X1 [Solanum pennellii]